MSGNRVEPKVTVYCSQFAQCGWRGKRCSDRVGEQAAPCPRCGREVVR